MRVRVIVPRARVYAWARAEGRMGASACEESELPPYNSISIFGLTR